MGTAVRGEGGDDSRRCMAQGLREPPKFPGKGGMANFLSPVV